MSRLSHCGNREQCSSSAWSCHALVIDASIKGSLTHKEGVIDGCCTHSTPIGPTQDTQAFQSRLGGRDWHRKGTWSLLVEKKTCSSSHPGIIASCVLKSGSSLCTPRGSRRREVQVDTLLARCSRSAVWLWCFKFFTEPFPSNAWSCC